jgi:hypothetical protein
VDTISSTGVPFPAQACASPRKPPAADSPPCPAQARASPTRAAASPPSPAQTPRHPQPQPRHHLQPRSLATPSRRLATIAQRRLATPSHRIATISSPLAGARLANPSRRLKVVGVGNRDSGPCQSARMECTRQNPGDGGHFGKPIQEVVPGLRRGPKAKPPCPTYSIFGSDCLLPALDSADRRLRPVIEIVPRSKTMISSSQIGQSMN